MDEADILGQRGDLADGHQRRVPMGVDQAGNDRAPAAVDALRVLRPLARRRQGSDPFALDQDFESYGLLGNISQFDAGSLDNSLLRPPSEGSCPQRAVPATH